MNVRRTTVAALSFAVFLTAACTSQVGGQANPSTTAGSSSSPTSTVNPSAPLAGLSPCTTLDQALAGLGFPTATPSVADEKHACSSQKIDTGTGKAVDAGLILQDGMKYDGDVANPAKASTGSVNDRKAVEERESLGSPGHCDISIEVKPNSRAVVIITAGSDTENACKIAEDYAAKVEPLLPKT